jgi:hypothetical protein
MEEVFEFLGVDSSVECDMGGIHNASSPPALPNLYRLLYSIWRPAKSLMPDTLQSRLQGPVRLLRAQFFQTGGHTKPDMNPAARAYLREVYAEPNRQLAEWLERDFSHWT